MGRNWDHMGGWNMGWSWLFLILLVVGIVLLVVVLVRVLRQPPPENMGSPRSSRSAREMLDERYARGEIDTAEYDERRQRLEYDT